MFQFSMAKAETISKILKNENAMQYKNKEEIHRACRVCSEI